MSEVNKATEASDTYISLSLFRFFGHTSIVFADIFQFARSEKRDLLNDVYISSEQVCSAMECFDN